MNKKFLFITMLVIFSLMMTSCIRPPPELPDRCSFPAGLDCIGNAEIIADKDEGVVFFMIQNSKGETITIDSGKISGDCESEDFLFDKVGASPTNQPITLENNEKAAVRITCDGIYEGRFSSDVLLRYTLESTGLELIASGVIRGQAS